MTDFSHSTETSIKAVVYCRISSVAQSQKGHGLASQETRCREFARAKGYEVTQVFQDRAVSGGVVDRPGISAMLAYLHEACYSSEHVVLIDDISRIARDIEAHLQLRRAISNAGAKLESPSIEFGEDSDSVLVENLLASVSQHQRQKNAEQTRNRMRARLQNGFWPFYAPLGFKFEKQAGRGKVLVRDEPIASVIQEALEGYACGRFQLQSEVTRFLQSQDAFPKTRFGTVTHETTNRILTRVLYAGMLEAPDGWDVPLTKGQHEAMISYETFQKIQERLKGSAQAPARADISSDFVLRGSVACADCGHPLTASWSKSKSGKKHPYYMCFKKGCGSYRKSIRRDAMEDAFGDLLEQLIPSRQVLTFAHGMFHDLWEQLQSQSESVRKGLERDLRTAEAQVEKLLDRIAITETPSVMSAYERKISTLESQKLVIAERLENVGKPRRTFRELFEHAMMLIANPRALWDTGDFAYRNTVLRLCFAEAPHYCRKNGFRTPESAYPFRVLRQLGSDESQMAEEEGFEPPGRVNAQRFSRPPLSTAQPLLRSASP